MQISNYIEGKNFTHCSNGGNSKPM